MGVAPAVLSRRGAAFAALVAGSVVWYVVARRLDELSLTWSIVIAAAAVVPAMLLLLLVVVPVWNERWTLPAAAVLALVAWGLYAVHIGSVENVCKLLVCTLVGFAFVTLFEELWWVVLVALVIPIADIVSVSRGPTHEIVTHHFGWYEAVSIKFPVPGNAFQFGPPDILFFALFLAACARWHLRVVPTWIAMTAMYDLALILASATSAGGIAALPFLSVGFLGANADLLWRSIRRSARSSSSSS